MKRLLLTSFCICLVLLTVGCARTSIDQEEVESRMIYNKMQNGINEYFLSNSLPKEEAEQKIKEYK